ncbi:MAG: toprim domain-containing protein [Deltaproteobacteria bacterium]|jgi:DNA primase|nr:toprim domain-containing protein [Deltaproteobacteria bacterium]
MPFSEQKIAEVRESADILAIIGRYVELKRSSGSNYLGLCPFHHEKTPSFTVNPDKGFFYCFGCHQGGDVFKFLTLISNITFPEAVVSLAHELGISLPQEDFLARNEKRSKERLKELTQVTRRAADIFVENLWGKQGLGVRNYLRKRGIADHVTRKFQLGYSLDEWTALGTTLAKEGFSPDLILEAGLVRRRERSLRRGYYDVFKGRLMIPILDADDNAVAFAGRLLDDLSPPQDLPNNVANFVSEPLNPSLSEDIESHRTPKYINSTSSPLYKKGNLLYGYSSARPYLKPMESVFVVEGYFDVITLVAKGFKNVVAAMGTALTQTQVNLLKGDVREIFLLFDGDEAGREAAKKALPKLLNAEIEGKVITLPPNEDPDSFLRNHDLDAFLALAEQATPALDYTVNKLLGAYPEGLIGQAKALREVKELLSNVPDNLKGQLLRNTLANRLGVSPESLALAIEKPEEVTYFPPPSPRPDYNYLAGKILFHAILHPETAIILKELKLYWPEDNSAPLFLEFLAQLDVLGKIEVASLNPIQNDSLNQLVSEAAVSPRQFASDQAFEVMQEFSERLKNSHVSVGLTRLLAQIKQAESSGDLILLNELLTQQKELMSQVRRVPG